MQPGENNQSSLGNIEQAIISIAQILKDSNVALSSNKYKFRAYRNNSAHSMSAAAFSKIQLNTIDYDTAAGFSTANNRYVVPVSGWWFIQGWILWGNSNVTIGIPSIFKNGVELLRGTDMRVATVNKRAGVGDLVFLAANDYIELHGYTDAAVGLDVTQAPIQNHLSGFLVSMS